MIKRDLPYPTPTRLAFADEIARGFIRWYNFQTPVAHHTVTGRKYTRDLDELVKAGIAKVPYCPEGSSSIAELTDLALVWRSGPGSTSPEPGPPTGWRDETTGLISGGLIVACSFCGSLEHEMHPEPGPEAVK